jgi:hypothetical protein
MKRYDVLFGIDNKILFQDETGIVDPRIVLDKLNSGEMFVYRSNEMTNISENTGNLLYRYASKINYVVE